MSRPSNTSASASAGGQRALAPVEKQPVAGAQHAEELAEDPRPLGVDLQRALAIGQRRATRT